MSVTADKKPSVFYNTSAHIAHTLGARYSFKRHRFTFVCEHMLKRDTAFDTHHHQQAMVGTEVFFDEETGQPPPPVLSAADGGGTSSSAGIEHVYAREFVQERRLRRRHFLTKLACFATAAVLMTAAIVIAGVALYRGGSFSSSPYGSNLITAGGGSASGGTGMPPHLRNTTADDETDVALAAAVANNALDAALEAAADVMEATAAATNVSSAVSTGLGLPANATLASSPTILDSTLKAALGKLAATLRNATVLRPLTAPPLVRPVPSWNAWGIRIDSVASQSAAAGSQQPQQKRLRPNLPPLAGLSGAKPAASV